MSETPQSVEEIKWVVFDLCNGHAYTRRYCFIFDREIEAERFRLMANIDTTKPSRLFFGYDEGDLPEHVPMKRLHFVQEDGSHHCWYEDYACSMHMKTGYLECSRL